MRAQAYIRRVAWLRAARSLVPRRHVILHGYYGAGNVGDEAVLLSSLEQLRELPGGLTPVVFCPNPERVRRAYGVPSLNPQTAGRRALVGVLLRSEAYLLGGGGLIKDFGAPEAYSLERNWLQWLELAQRMGLKTMLWSVGVENVRFERSKGALKEALADTDVITVRDANSVERLREVGVERPIHVTADPVPWLARKYARARPRPPRPRVVACMRHWYPHDFIVPDEEANERMIAAVARALDYLAERHGAEVAFVPFRTTARDDDREACRAVQSHMRAGAVVYDEAEPGVEATMERIAGADLVVGMRLHASVIATTMGVPAVALSYMPKVRDYMGSIGQEDLCLDVEGVTWERLIARLDKALGEYEARSEELLAASAGVAARFETNRSLLDHLILGE